MKKKLSMLFSIVFTLGIILGACGAPADPTPDALPDETGDVTETADFSVGMVTDTGGVDDRSFNQAAWEGMTQFGEDYNLTANEQYKYLQSGDPGDYGPNLNALIREGMDLTWGIGYLMTDDIRTIAEQQPNAQLAIVDSVVVDDNGEPLPNVAHVTFKEHEGSFLVGLVAGMHTNSNKIGFIGGVEGFLIKKFENGFKAGVKMANPDAEVIVQYAETFNDASVGQSIANTMYGQGADIIYHAAGGTGNGLFTEAKNRKRAGEEVWVIGVDRDQHEEGMPDNVTLTSMIKRVDTAVYSVSELTMHGEFPGGIVLEFGLAENGVGIAPTIDNVSPEAIDTVNQFIERIQAGEIDVPQTDDEYEEFLTTL